MKREETKKVIVNGLEIGGNNHIYIQSMTNTKTKDIKATVDQILELEKYGCEIIRVAVKDMEDALAIKGIKEQIHIPLVADIHFDYRLALASINSGVDKVRLNPGNLENIDHIKEVVNLCKEKHIPIRIGVNSGSLPKDLDKTKEGMIEAAKRQVSILEELGFNDIVLSFKSSDINLTIDSYLLASTTFPYPLHLGLTETGGKIGGLVKSTIALSELLKEGIGNTIRVSLSSNPKDEVISAKYILRSLGLYKQGINLISCPTCGRTSYDLISLVSQAEGLLETVNKNIKVAIMGCVVNGLGEAKDANIALMGLDKENLMLFVDSQKIKQIKVSEALDVLQEEILKYGN